VKLLLRICLIFICTATYSQPFNNDWIVYDQSYYKFKISEEGIYRISRQTLIESNVPVSSIDPRNISIYAKGEEIPIYFSGESDGVFDATDYIEFYAKGNDGWLDTALYKSSSNQPNPYYSLFNDTLTYFLSWNNSTSNRRYKEENASDFANYFAASYVWKESIEEYHSSYYDGEILTGGSTDPEYVKSEGWMNSPLTIGKNINKSINARNRYVSGPFVEFEAKIAGASNWSAVNNGDHHIRLKIGNQTIDRVFEGYDLITVKQSFSPTEIIAGQNIVNIESIDDRNSNVDRTALAFMKITYPHTMNFANTSYYDFIVEDAANQDAQFVEILLFNGGNNPLLYDVTNQKRIKVVRTLSNYRALIPNGNGRKKCIIASESEVRQINKLEAVGTNGKFTNYALQQLDTSYMILTSQKLITEATTYAAYRRSTGYSTMVIDVDELTDQYAFGISKHPLAIRNFMDDALSNWTFPISNLFLIGKSVSAKLHRQAQANIYAQNLVPTIGNPSTDNLFLTGLQNSNLEAAIPVGRLSAKTISEIDIYLDKVKEFESAPHAQWMKRALHFAGGKSTFEANRHEGFLNTYALDFQSLPQGGQVQTFRKSTSAPFQTSLSDSIRTLINEGVSLLTFFGHSSTTGGFDINIDSPDKLQNRGRYHMILANSCFAGNTHQPNIISTSESYVLERNRGAIAFVATGNLGLAFFLDQYSSAFYRNLYSKAYGKSIGECMQFAVRDIQSQNLEGPLKSVILEMSLQGDPALVLNAQSQADYSVEIGDVEVSPNEITTDLDSFRIRVNAKNIGRFTNDSIWIQIKRKFPNSAIEDEIILKRIPPIAFDREFQFSFPINIINSVGLNEFTFLIDAFNETLELNENNNQIDFDVLVRSGEIIPVFPYEYAIVGNQQPTLKAATAFPFEEEKSYVFELDTSINFNSNFKASATIPSLGGVIEWSPSVLSNMQDSSVYFWRVSKMPQAGEPFDWRTSSFQYLNGESGWSQDHFNQFQDNDRLFLKLDQAKREIQFTDRTRELFVQTYGNLPDDKRNDVKYVVDADTRERGSCFPSPGFLIAVLDSNRLESWETPYFGLNAQNEFGQANRDDWCSPFRNRPEAIFNFQVEDSLQMQKMKEFLNNKIPDGAYVIIFNWFDIEYSKLNAMDSSILKSIENLGSTKIRSIKDDHPFIFTVQKGKKSSVMEVVGDSTNSAIELRRNLSSSAEFGEMTSTIIGPTDNFRRLAYEFRSLESNSSDSVRFEIRGIDRFNGSEDILYAGNELRMDTATSSLVDNSIYDQLKIKFFAFDQANQTPPQLKRWQLSYTELPDLSINPNELLNVKKDTLLQGEKFEMEVAISNISNVDIDSVKVKLRLVNVSGQIQEIDLAKLPPVNADSTVILNINIPTLSQVGKNTLFIEINPSLEIAEQYAFNNIGQYDFFVTRDRNNPLLDVTFDGRHIINGEIISSKPLINISLEDDNKYLAIDDTASILVSLVKPDGSEEQLTYGVNANYQLRFTPANLPENKARVIFTPELAMDGIYRLKVQASDKSGNESGQLAYQIDFEVINRSTVTHLLNYPNPFSTSTRFVFTLTGSEIPDQILIQIMTITGKVVREINQFELGPIHIGTNVTEYSWDGKDQYGDQLANGVYLYRVKMKLNGGNIERRASKADQYFKKDFGKMYLLR